MVPAGHFCHAHPEELIAEKIETVLSDRGSGSSLLSVDAKDELEAKIRAALTEDRLYLNPNLKIGELADAVKSNRKYVSIVMKERFGSFYKELNRLRIEAAVRYREEHPSASREEIATHCGFSNVRTYSRNLKSGMQDKNNCPSNFLRLSSHFPLKSATFAADFNK